MVFLSRSKASSLVGVCVLCSSEVPFFQKSPLTSRSVVFKQAGNNTRKKHNKKKATSLLRFLGTLWGKDF